MPEVWRMMNAIFSAVQSDAATIRSPSPSRSSSSVTTTSSPLAKACRTSWIESAILRVSLCAWRALTGLKSPRQLHYAGQKGSRVVAIRWRQSLHTCIRSEPTKNKGDGAHDRRNIRLHALVACGVARSRGESPSHEQIREG